MDQKDIDRIIEMAWEDKTPFEAIHVQFGFTEGNVIALMRKNLKRSSLIYSVRESTEVSAKNIHEKKS